MESLTCSTNWLDDTTERKQIVSNQERRIQAGNAFTTSNNSASISSSGYYIGSYWYPYYQPYFPTTVAPIDLKLSEVEYLRKQAKNDKKLREILQKFTGNIRITVDFE